MVFTYKRFLPVPRRRQYRPSMSDGLQEPVVSKLEDLTPHCEDCMTRWSQGHIQPRKPFTNPSPEDTCPICHEQYDCARHAPFLITKVEGCVGHVFGLNCLINWLVSDMNPDSCPICRSVLFNYSKRDHDGIERRVQNLPLPLPLRVANLSDMSVEAVVDVLADTVQQFRDLENSIRAGQRDSAGENSDGEYTEDEIREILEDAAEWDDYISDGPDEDEDDPGHNPNDNNDGRDVQVDVDEPAADAPDSGDATPEWLRDTRNEDGTRNDQNTPQRRSREQDTEETSESGDGFECPTLRRVRNNIIDKLLVVYFKQRYAKSVTDVATQTDEVEVGTKKSIETLGNGQKNIEALNNDQESFEPLGNDQKNTSNSRSSQSKSTNKFSDGLHWVVPGGLLALALGFIGFWVTS